MTSAFSRTVRQLSLPLAATVTGLFMLGAGTGLISYLGRSPARQAFVPGSSAWPEQIAVAVLTVLLLVVARRRSGGWQWLLAPVGKPAARRLARTLRAAGQHGAWRALAGLLPAAALLYCPWRCGKQVIGGLDPNSTVNAWGGPSYLGAMACHYLDLFLVMAVAAWLLDRILLPDPADSARGAGGSPLVAAPSGRPMSARVRTARAGTGRS